MGAGSLPRDRWALTLCTLVLVCGRETPPPSEGGLKAELINSHFAIPPYLQIELRTPGVHVVTTSEEIAGGVVSNGTIFLTVRFADANPKIVAALYAALKASVALIDADPQRAAVDYLAVSAERSAPAEIEALIKIPGTVYDVAPHGILTMAKFLHRTGMVAIEPQDWKEMYLPLVWGESGS